MADRFSVAEIDESGGVIWKKIYNEDGGLYGRDIHKILGSYDSGYVITGYVGTDDYYRGTGSGMVMALDETGATIKQILFGEKGNFNDITKIMPMSTEST